VLLFFFLPLSFRDAGTFRHKTFSRRGKTLGVEIFEIEPQLLPQPINQATVNLRDGTLELWNDVFKSFFLVLGIHNRL